MAAQDEGYVATFKSCCTVSIAKNTFDLEHSNHVIVHSYRSVVGTRISSDGCDLYSPTATVEWLARGLPQITEAFPRNEAPRYLIRDRDRTYGATFHADCGPWASQKNRHLAVEVTELRCYLLRCGSSLLILGAMLALLLYTVPAQAQLNRTWVASYGSGGACSRTDPCGSFQAAHDATNPGGEINCIDAGNYGGRSTWRLTQSAGQSA